MDNKLNYARPTNGQIELYVSKCQINWWGKLSGSSPKKMYPEKIE